jgi:uncharacterized protein
MNVSVEGSLLRIYVGESDKHGHVPSYEAIVLKARESGLAGATVLRGVMGFGRHSVMHSAKILRLSEDLPMIVEIVDTKENIEAFVPIVESMAPEAILTVEPVQVLHLR